MKIILRNIKLDYREPAEEALSVARKKLKYCGITPNVLTVHKRSVDARKKDAIKFVYSVLADCSGKVKDATVEKCDAVFFSEPTVMPACGEEPLSARPLVVGFGPCGMFAGLALAEKGYRPIIIERGDGVTKRQEKVKNFLENGILDTDCNIQFGAGGAGTFSDGKLVTRVNDPLGATVLEILHRFGAPDSILTLAKPHIGTDKLAAVVENIKNEIERLGGEVCFGRKLEEIKTDSRGRVIAVKTNAGEIACGALILAIGHSARDSYKMLYQGGYQLQAKDFSVGVRVEHLQEDIDRALYGDADISILGHAEYSLSHRDGARGVYSFCMCPGGTVVCASSEEGGLVVNGMSNYLRDGRNANSAIAVSVLKEDYGNDPMKAVAYQRTIEQTAYQAAGGGYRAPVQTLGNFLEGKKGGVSKKIIPTFRQGDFLTEASLSDILPPHVNELLQKGFPYFERSIKGYSDPEAVLIGVETRTSAPLRILREEMLTAPGHDNLYPAGEGAGYAGGITSAAIDGLRVASAIVSRYKP